MKLTVNDNVIVCKAYLFCEGLLHSSYGGFNNTQQIKSKFRIIVACLNWQ